MEVQAIVDNLAQNVRRPITLEDAGGRLVAYSIHDQPVDTVRMETLLRKGASSVTLEALRSRGVYQAVDSSPGVARVPAIPEIGFGPRACVAIKDAERVLGYLWVADAESNLPKSAEDSILRARHFLSQELGRRESTLVIRQEQREQFIAELCGEEHLDSELLLSSAKTLGWYSSPPLQAIVVRAQVPDGVSEARVPAVDEVVAQYAPASMRGTYRGDTVVVVYGREAKSVSDLASALAGLTAGDRNLAVGVGGACTSLSQVRKSYLEGASAIVLGARLGGSAGYFDYSTLAPYELLSCLATCRKAGSFGRDAVDRVITYDGLHSGSLLDTLEAFLDFHGKRKAAASRLNIHPNTLDYRVRKARELMGLDLDDPNVRLVVHIWVKALSGLSRGMGAAQQGRK